MAKFEELLLERLKQHEPDPGAALAPRRRLTPVAAVAITAIAALAAVLLPSLGDNGSAAHAVTRNPDGTLLISLGDFKDTDAANRELRDLGVTNVVIVRAQQHGSCAPEDRPGPVVPHPDDVMEPVPANGKDVVLVRPDRIPPNSTLLISGTEPIETKEPVPVFAGGFKVVASKERYCEEIGGWPTGTPAPGQPTVSPRPAPTSSR